LILLTLDFTNLTNFKLLLIQTFTFYLYKPLLLLIVMTQKKSTPKKAPKRAQRVERVERVEHSAPKDNKKRARSPSDDDEEESDERSKKERRSNRNKLADTTQKTAPQKRKATAQR
jgi:hypothetical protein